jgi:hypothetical protein
MPLIGLCQTFQLHEDTPLRRTALSESYLQYLWRHNPLGEPPLKGWLGGSSTWQINQVSPDIHSTKLWGRAILSFTWKLASW